MALFLVLEDFSDGAATAAAGAILDSATIDLAPLQAAGLAVVPYNPATMGAPRAAFLAARGSRPSVPDTAGDLSALLLAAGAIGGLPQSVNTFLAGAHSNSTPALIGGVYVPFSGALAASSQALIHCPAAGRQGQITLHDIVTSAIVATFTTAVATGDEYLVAPVTGTPTLAAGFYNVGIASLAGGAVNAHALFISV